MIFILMIATSFRFFSGKMYDDPGEEWSMVMLNVFFSQRLRWNLSFGAQSHLFISSTTWRGFLW